MKKTLKIIIILILFIIVLATGIFFGLQSREEKDYSFNYDPGEYFVTDIQGSRRLLKTDMIIAMADRRESDYYLQYNHRVRNSIIFVLRNKSEDELMKPNIEAILNQEIINRLNSEFETDEFIRISFNEFVIQ